ncbi:hypothetical protein [Lysobacter sp. CA199]|uniref:hypothetical protein n=1 Tax=Lysobacter sp. CA199 TaxID=3455608 RepID=UPI003F8D489D
MNSAVDFKGCLLTALNSARPEREVKKLLRDFESSLLGYEFMPDGDFSFVIFFIQTAPALQLKCAANLFLMLHIEFYLLSATQICLLIEVVRASNFISGGSEEAVLACADMFARNLGPVDARSMFEEASEAGAQAFSSFGQDVMRIRSLRSI